MVQFPAIIDLSTLEGSNGFKLSGAAKYDRSGSSVASAGDVNGDGFADLIVGAPDADPHGDRSGASYVVFGKASGLAANIDLSSLNGSNGFRLSGVAQSDRSATSVASAGDVNGDGFADVIVGAMGADPHGSDSGASYVVFGKASGFTANIDLSSLDGRNGFKLSGVTAGDRSGYSVASAGDINGDGFADLIVGASAADPHGSYSGASYVVFGKPFGFAANVDLANLDGSNGFKLSGVASRDFSGSSVASAGDVNGDGFADLIVGASAADPHGSYSGTSYVMFGKASGFAANVDLSSLDGSNGFKLSGAAEYDESGYSVASAGDVNGDGYADLIVGAPQTSKPYGEVSGGESYVVFGKASGFAANFELSSLDGSNGFKLSGRLFFSSEDQFEGEGSGFSVASAGDVNGDGFADLIVGAPFNVPGYQNGASYVVFGKPSGFAANIYLSDINGSDGFKISNAAGELGRSVASAGDVNGDGFADLILGDGWAGPQGSTIGESYVLFGLAPDTAVNRVGTAASQTLAGGAFDDVLAGQGGDDRLFGNGGSDELAGGAGNDLLDGGTGTDCAVYSNKTVAVSVTLAGAANASVYVGGLIEDTLRNIENVKGGEGNDKLIGDGLANSLDGGDGNDILDGGSGSDTLVGGLGNDTYLNDGGDTLIEAANGGTDLVRSSVTVELGANMENLILTGAAAINGTGNNLANILTGNHAANILDGVGGSDTLIGGLGDDTYLNSGGDTIIEAADAGTDLVRSSVSFTLGANLENLTLSGSAAIDGRGNDLANAMTGNGAANQLFGGDGNDILRGRGGDDSMSGGLGADTLDGGDGIDQARYASSTSGVTVSLAITGWQYTGSAAGIDKLVRIENLLGSNFDDVLKGNSEANTLMGGDGDDILDGVRGADTLIGGLGDDTYLNDGGDTIIEAAAEGTDLVRSSVTITMSANLEQLILTGYGAIDGTGNGLDNEMIGNDAANQLFGGEGNDRLFGRGGNDRMSGGFGDDTLFSGDGYGDGYDTLDGGDGIDSANYFEATAGVMVNLAIAGTQDTGAAGFVQLINIENLAGSQFADVLSGNSKANALFGGFGDDILDGAGGADTLEGGPGNDTYLSDGSETIIEEADAGTDLVRSSVTFTLGFNLEKLILTGSAAIDGTGNGLSNVMTGNQAANQLFGGEGNDILRGRGGDDSMSGGVGDDKLDGGNGIDQARYASSTAGVTVSLATYGPQDTGGAGIDTLIGIEDLVGSRFADVLTGNTAGNILSGGGSNDMLTGGGGNDTFQFDVPLVAGASTTITDFAAGGDKVALARAVFTQAGALGPLSRGAFFIGSAAHDASDRIIYNAETGALLYDADGTGGQGAVQFASVSQGLGLSVGDFKVV